MFTFLLIMIIIACVLLVLIILAQNPKGGGLSPTFGGMGSPVMGARKTADILEKATWYIGIGIIVVVLLTNFFIPRDGVNADRSRIQDMAPNLRTNPVHPDLQQRPPADQQQQPGTQQQNIEELFGEPENVPE